jgi:hypothetical protein
VVSHLKKIPFASLQCLTSKAEPPPISPAVRIHPPTRNGIPASHLRPFFQKSIRCRGCYPSRISPPLPRACPWLPVRLRRLRRRWVSEVSEVSGDIGLGYPWHRRAQRGGVFTNSQ